MKWLIPGMMLIALPLIGLGLVLVWVLARTAERIYAAGRWMKQRMER